MTSSILNRTPWTRGEKWVLALSLGAVLAASTVAVIDNLKDSDPHLQVPNPVMPNPNGFDYAVVASQSAMESWPMPGNRRLPMGARTRRPTNQLGQVPPPNLHDPKVMAAAVSLVKANQPAVAGLHTALSYTFLSPPVRSYQQSLSYLSNFRRITRVLAFDAAVEKAKGNPDGTVGPGLDAVRLGNAMMRGGVQIQAMVGISCQTVGRKPLWETISAMSSSGAKRAASILSKIDASAVPTVDVLREEKWFGIAALEEIFRDKDWKLHAFGPSQSMTGNGQPMEDWHARMQMLMLGKAEVVKDYVAGMDARIAAAQQGYGTAPKATPTDPLSHEFLDNSSVLLQMAYNVAENRLLMTDCALRAFELDHGRYPSTLAALVPAYLPAVPRDPFTASSTLAYRLTGKSYVLYSLGPDKTDDGGKPVPQPNNNDWEDPRDDMKGDIVAGVNR